MAELLALTLDVSQTPLRQTTGAHKKVAPFPLSISKHGVHKSAVILLLAVSAVKAPITRLSLAVRPIEAL